MSTLSIPYSIEIYNAGTIQPYYRDDDSGTKKPLSLALYTLISGFLYKNKENTIVFWNYCFSLSLYRTVERLKVSNAFASVLISEPYLHPPTYIHIPYLRYVATKRM